jgi:hypothetical protein
VDGRWNAVIPAGRRTVYANHDSSNAAQFSTNQLSGTPSVITVREL